ncbi:MAG: acyl-CoA dehydrogenase [Gemmatimonadetes bacterium]|nr:acyl-CoA dehydrogenase [Gemmatimonadota bacterium]MYA11204.1 acyl-CoA dehydrogenase [Gemmatimonadota bacterium]MYD15432.1 acyl-CoA dehydrogenase [Gemmatimonadota bacterium]MYE70997.1 acyl-CoA dehydrogenase [Gemmatimonadota bacterium]MYI66172.1 acyl-CoA dehydrogenase [Gemmatimonadota bacterium]
MTNTANRTNGTGSDARHSREVAESAREARWEKRSFMKELFGGRLSLELIHPHPAQDPEEAARAAPFLKALERFTAENIDGDAVDRDAWVPESVLEGLAELGAFGIKIPREYGGLGLSQISYNRALALVASRCASTAAFLSAHQSIGVPTPLVLFGTEEQKREYLPRAAGGALSAFALTEPEVGSDPANMSTFAEPSEDGDHYILNGEKLWTTNGPRAELLVVMARTPARPGVRGKRPISAFIVETDWPGVEVGHICSFMGLRGISNGVLHFRDVKVPRENLLWGEGLGLKLALITLNTGRLALPAFCAAGAKALLRLCRTWAAKREQWGAPIGKHDAVAQMLGRMTAQTYAMDASVDLAAAMSGLGTLDIRLEAATAKLWHSETLWDMVDDAVQIRGGRGYETADSLRARGEDPAPVERCMRDARINLIFEGSSEIMRLFIAREAVDAHLSVAGKVIDPRLSTATRLAALVKAGAHYALWYPSRWLGWGRWPRYGDFGPLAGHMRYANRKSRKLARTIFHAMIRFGPKLELRQAVLGRLVDIGCDLFIMTSACVRAMKIAAEQPGNGTAFELADTACLLARRRIDAAFRQVFRNDDTRIHRIAQRAMADRYSWLEQGICD